MASRPCGCRAGSGPDAPRSTSSSTPASAGSSAACTASISRGVVRVHAVRADVGAPGVPVLRRAGVQDAVRRVRSTVPAAEAAIATRRELERSAAPDGARARALRDRPSRCRPTSSRSRSGRSTSSSAPPLPPNAVRDRAAPAARRRGARPGPAARATRSSTRRADRRALERYFGIAYPYDKLDLIAVPDFAAGAMENAGAITFRESLLLLDEASAPEDQQRAFASVHGARARAPVVRQPGHDAVVGRHLAERGVRDLDGARKIVDDVHPEHRAGIGLLRERAGRDGRRQPRVARAASASRSRARTTSTTPSTRSPTRRAPACSRCSSAGSGAEAFRTGIRAYLRRTPLRQRDGERSARGALPGVRARRGHAVPHLPRAAGRAVRRDGARVRAPAARA